MPSDRSVLERQIESVELRPFTLDGFHRRLERKRRNRRVGTAVVALAVAAAAIGGVAGAFLSGQRSVPAEERQTPFVDTWVSTDEDGNSQTMTIRASGAGAYEIVVHADAATVCSGSPSTMTGTGRLEGATALVLPEPVLICDDGTEPEVLSGPPLDEQLRNLTFVHDPESDTLSDSFELVWERSGTTEASGGMWPQSNLEEARRAQRLADEGDPRYTWQVDPEIFDKPNPGAELFTRFLREKLGWEEFRRGVGGDLYPDDGPWEVLVVRCAPGRTNPLYPTDLSGGGCAPTLDGFRYETVKISADQPVRQTADRDAAPGPSAGLPGIWVVTRWEMLPPSDAPITDIGDFFGQQVEQVAPPSDAEATAFMRAFLQARMDGEGAERYLHSHAEQAVAEQACSVHTSASCEEIPLFYATTSGAPYKRFELELVEGPVWPGGWTEFNVRLFAEGAGSIVEQSFLLHPGEDGRLGLVYDTLADEPVQTTENGEPLGDPYELLDGEVTFAAGSPWYEFFDYGPDTIALVGGPVDFAVLADPLPVEAGCRGGPAPADAEGLARNIRSDPDLEVTEPAPEDVGGIEALRMDVVAPTGASVCDYVGTTLVVRDPDGGQGIGPALGRGDRMRLYVLDLPEGSSARILAIAIVVPGGDLAPEASFEMVLEEAAAIVDSFEFHAP